MKNMDYLMELIVMCVQVISKVFVLLLLFVAISFAQRDSIMADFCVYPDTSKLTDTSKFVKVKHILRLSPYRDRIPLNITLDFGSHSFSKGLSASLLGSIKVFHFPLVLFGGGGGDWFRRKESISVYDYLDFYCDIKDSLPAISMFDKTYSLHWELDFKMNLQKQKIIGDNIIYISGFCTDEQLKLIQERKKKRKDVAIWP
jgi:hypothetical protein